MKATPDRTPAQLARAALGSFRDELNKLLKGDTDGVVQAAKLDQLVRRYLVLVVAACSGSIPAAAKLLDVHRRTVERNLTRRKIRKPRKR